MPTPLSVTEEFAASPDAIHALFIDSAFLQSRLEGIGAIDPQVVSVTPADDAVATVTRQSIPASALPSAISAMMPGAIVTERSETWKPSGDGYAADFAVTVKGAPASLKGTMTLAPGGAGTTLTVEGTATVPIPLFGGKIEQTIAEQVGELITLESDYLRSHLPS